MVVLNIVNTVMILINILVTIVIRFSVYIDMIHRNYGLIGLAEFSQVILKEMCSVVITSVSINVTTQLYYLCNCC